MEPLKKLHLAEFQLCIPHLAKEVKAEYSAKDYDFFQKAVLYLVRIFESEKNQRRTKYISENQVLHTALLQLSAIIQSFFKRKGYLLASKYFINKKKVGNDDRSFRKLTLVSKPASFFIPARSENSSQK